MSTAREANGSLGLALAALAAAGVCFELPALDDVTPGGAFYWQVTGVLLALYAAWQARRQSEGLAGRARAGIRLLAAAAVSIALVWVAGVAVLWLVWPR